MYIVPLHSCDESNKILYDINDDTICSHQSLHNVLHDGVLYAEIIS